MYIHYSLIAWARLLWSRLLWSRPQTTNHVVLVRPGGDRRVKKIVREPKWSRSSPSVIMLESEDGNKGTLHQKRVRQRRKESDRYLHDTSLTFWNSSHHRFACYLHRYISSPAPRTNMLHVITTDIYLHISGYSSARGACVFLILVYYTPRCNLKDPRK